jgi:predicted phage terminase large subunit-like protein
MEARPVNYKDLSLMDLIPALSPEYQSPWHMREWCDVIERAAVEPVRALCALPIRHWKTQVTLHGIVYLLLRDPSRKIILLSHSFERAQSLGKRLRQLAEAAGVGPERGTNTIADWANSSGGGCVVMSADQSRLGYDVHVLVFDDPLDENGSQDPKVREAVDETLSHYSARCQRRGQPGPVIGVMSRWHPDDAIGRRLQRTAVKWEYIAKGAILDEGEPTERAFAPDVWPLDALKNMRAELAEKDPTERLWWAQLMNEPRPIGADLFREPTRYSALPTWGYRLAYGADLAFTQGDHSDFFALVAMRVYGPKAYLLDVQRHKIDAHMIESTTRAMINKYGRAPIFSYASGPEVGMMRVLNERGLPFSKMQARYNKLVRAERTIRRWNDGNVLIPDDALWAPGFLHRVACFRGNDKDDGDDEIDALVSACDGAMGGMVAGGPRTVGKTYAGINSGRS